MSLSSLRHHRIFRAFAVTGSALAMAGVLGVALVAAQFAGASSAHAYATGLRYVPGYSVQGSWLCYGWSGHAYNAYHCTQHWYRSGGTLVSTNTAWVPNVGASVTTYHAPVSQPAVHTTAAPSTPVYTGGGSVAGMIASTFGPYAGAALAVASCESGLNPGAVNPSSDASGVFQFLPSTWATTSYAGYSPFNAWANVQAAHQVFMRDGYSWREWVCQP